MILQLYLTQWLILLCLSLVLIIIKKQMKKTPEKKSRIVDNRAPPPPTPRFQLPIIGHLHLLGGYKIPYQAFTDLGKKYGNVIKLQLGNCKCAVINGQLNIRQVLINKGHHFDARPNFQRYQLLFDGNKENSLAFCDWSMVQKNRRDTLKHFTFPKMYTMNFSRLEQFIKDGVNNLTFHCGHFENGSTSFKSILLQVVANIFINHFCLKNFNVSNKLRELCDNYDDIFYQINQGYAADFLPFLLPLHQKTLREMSKHAKKIRNFILNEIIKDRYHNYHTNMAANPDDYIDTLIKNVKESNDLKWDEALFALEDIIGGHSAVANFLMKLFGLLVGNQHVQKQIQQEIDDKLGEKPLKIGDKRQLPIIEATIYEAIRLISSPIVPRVANRDSTVNNFLIEKDTVLFLNNYQLNMDPELWTNPELFQPERFLNVDGNVAKPDHFLPFGGGRRGCMGYKMVQLISFGLLGGILQNYTILPIENELYDIKIGSLALPKQTFSFRFEKRRENVLRT